MPTGMRRGWQLTGAIMLLICIITAFEARDLSLFDKLGPGPGFFPFWLSLIGAVLCAVVLVQVSLTPAATPTDADPPTIFPRGALAWRVGSILLAAALGTALLDWLGFRLGMTIFSAVLMVALGERRWWAIALFSVVVGFGVFHVFNNWLDVLLPVGVFGI
ncbi:MAG: tripartite tricarboxylate transporter TctB family protein [Acetobacteraceae bacterium]